MPPEESQYPLDEVSGSRDGVTGLVELIRQELE